MTWLEYLQATLLLAGAAFFVVGTIGLIRFPDVYTRIHALTKADNLGLGLIVFGLLPSAGSIAVALKLLVIWLLALVAGSTAAYLVARAARHRDVAPWTGRNGGEG